MSGSSLTASPRLLILAALVLIVGVGAGYWIGARKSGGASQDSGQGASGEVLYWYDPMVPDQHFDEPGKSPFMDMELVPRYAGETPDASTVSIDPGVAQNLGVRLATAMRAPVEAEMTVSGTLTFNDRDVAVIQARTSGFVERGRRLAIGDLVRRGDTVVELRSPQWSSAIAEYLSLRRSSNEGLTSAARSRLSMLGVPEGAISAAEASSETPDTFAIRAPLTGAVTALGAKDGMNVSEGMPLATINGLSPVWLIASVPQRTAGQLRPGSPVEARLASYPGEQFEGQIESVLPQASMTSRTVEVRVALENADGRLRPGMTAEVELSAGEPREALLVPAESVIRTGRRSVVIVVDAESGGYAPTEVAIGASHGDRIEIVEGLSEGQRVVASGQFLIDSEASLTGVLARLDGAMAAGAPGVHISSGRVTGIDDAGVTIAHEPVPSLDWPSMTMHFDWGADGARPSLQPGDDVDFRFSEGGAGYVIEEITPKGDHP